MHVATLRSTSATRDIFLPHYSTMKQAELRRIWLDAPANRLCAWEVAKALGLREASKEIHGGNGRLPWIAARLKKVGGGCPTAPSLHELFSKIDSDSDWFPGKHTGKKRGPKTLLTAAKRRCIASSAMAAKSSRGDEPSANVCCQFFGPACHPVCSDVLHTMYRMAPMIPAPSTAPSTFGI